MSNFFRKPFKYTYKRITLFLILINFGLFFLSIVLPELYPYLCLNPAIMLQYQMYWQTLTYMFMHADMQHIFLNMLALLVFGLKFEKAVGSKEFILFYLFCGIASGLFSFAVYYFTGNFYVTLLGASGAIYAVLFAYAVAFPRSVILIWGIIPVPAPILVLIYAIIEVWSQLTGRSGGTAHLTHLFGFAAAWIYFAVRMKINPLKIWKNS